MPSFTNVVSGATVQAQDVQQLIDALKGTAGLGIPLSPTAVNDSVNFALAVKNTETTNSRALQVLRANNVVLLQADANGLIGSVDGIAAAAQLVNVSLAQTLTNKTLTAPHFTTPVVDSGGLVVTAGNLTLTNGNLIFSTAPGSITLPFSGGASVAMDMSGNTLRINTGNASGGVQIVGGTSLGGAALTPPATGLLVNGATPAISGSALSLGNTIAALGGGAAPTFGTIGGSGPTAAAQQSWWAINIGGVARFAPLWG